jgi:hypothetical protein
MGRAAGRVTQAGTTRNKLASNGDVIRRFTREYFDNGLVAYDEDRQRFGVVSDYDQPGECFVIRINQAATSVCLPVSLVKQVRRGKVYVGARTDDLTDRTVTILSKSFGARLREILVRVFGVGRKTHAKAMEERDDC